MSLEMVRVRRAAVGLAVLPCAAAVLAACQSISIDSGPPNFSQQKAAATLSPPTSSSPSGATSASSSGTPSASFSGPTPTTPSVAPSTAPPASSIPGTATSLASYLKAKYASASWYGDVTRVDKASGGQTVETKLQPAHTQVTGPATSICKAVRNFQMSQGGPAEVTVNAKGGVLLKRVTKTQSC